MKIEEIQEFDKILMPWIGRLTKMFGAVNQEVFRDQGININKEQLIILKHLVKEDGLVQNDLAFITEKDKTTLTRLINRMEKNELLKRVQCKEDNRCNKIFITEKGREKYEKVYPVFLKNIMKIQEDLSEKEIDGTIKILKKVTNKLKINYNEIK